MKTNQSAAEHYQWGAGCDGWHLLKQPNLSVIQEQMSPGTSEGKHLHEKAEQFFFVLQGRLRIEINGDTYDLSPREGLHIPPGAEHQVINASEATAEFLVVSSPPSHGDRVAV